MRGCFTCWQSFHWSVLSCQHPFLIRSYIWLKGICKACETFHSYIWLKGICKACETFQHDTGKHQRRAKVWAAGLKKNEQKECTYRYMCIHARTHTHSHTHMHTHTHSHVCTHMRTHAHTHTCARTLTHTHLHVCPYTHTHMCTHTHARTHTYTHTHMLTRTHTHTHTQIHTLVLQPPCNLAAQGSTTRAAAQTDMPQQQDRPTSDPLPLSAGGRADWASVPHTTRWDPRVCWSTRSPDDTNQHIIVIVRMIRVAIAALFSFLFSGDWWQDDSSHKWALTQFDSIVNS